MAANGNMNGHVNGYGNANEHPQPPVNQADDGQQNPQPNLNSANRVAAFRRCNPPIYDGSELGLAA